MRKKSEDVCPLHFQTVNLGATHEPISPSSLSTPDGTASSWKTISHGMRNEISSSKRDRKSPLTFRQNNIDDIGRSKFGRA